MKKFNLEDAKAGKAIGTKAGEHVRILCTNAAGAYPVVALRMKQNGDGGETEVVMQCTLEGRQVEGLTSCLDLCMVSTHKVGWVNVYPGRYTGGKAYASKENALADARGHSVATIQVEWEE